MKNKITVSVTTQSGSHNILLPQSQNQFDQTLTSIGIFTGNKSEYTIQNATSTVEAINSIIQNARDIEELNYLARLIDGMDDKEVSTYEAIVKSSNINKDIISLINIAYNLLDYSIEPSINDLDELGEEYINSGLTGLDADELNDINTKQVGTIIKSLQNGIFTEIGYVHNIYSAFSNHYKGDIFPDYMDETDCILRIQLARRQDNHGVEIYLPASQNVINRAMNRLGVNDLSECKIADYSSDYTYVLEECFSPRENIEKLNELIQKISTIPQNSINKYVEELDKNQHIKNIADIEKFTSEFINNHVVDIQQDKSKEQIGMQKEKPKCPLIGADSNIFNLIGIVSRTLKEHGMQEEAKEMKERVQSSENFDKALSIIMEYVTPVGNGNESEDLDEDFEEDIDEDYKMNMHN